MDLKEILAFLAPLAPLLKSELLSLEGKGQDELKQLIGQVSSPDLKALLMALDQALDSFAQLEINNLP